MDNHAYNLMRQLVQEQTSLWRIKNEYLTDSSTCDECKELWGKLAKDKESHVEELQELVKEHL